MQLPPDQRDQIIECDPRWEDSNKHMNLILQLTVIASEFAICSMNGFKNGKPSDPLSVSPKYLTVITLLINSSGAMANLILSAIVNPEPTDTSTSLVFYHGCCHQIWREW